MLGVYTSGISGGKGSSLYPTRPCRLTLSSPHKPSRHLRQLRVPRFSLAKVSSIHASAGAWSDGELVVAVSYFQILIDSKCASGVVYANYMSAIDAFEGHGVRTVPGYSDTATAGIFCTYPAEFMTKTGQFFSEFIASTLLMFLIYALKDDGNIGAGPLTPLGLFFIIFGIGGESFFLKGFGIASHRHFRTCMSTDTIFSLLWMGNRLCDQSGSRFRSSADVVSCRLPGISSKADCW